MALFHFGIAHGDPRRPRRGSPPCLLGVMSRLFGPCLCTAARPSTTDVLPRWLSVRDARSSSHWRSCRLSASAREGAACLCRRPAARRRLVYASHSDRPRVPVADRPPLQKRDPAPRASRTGSLLASGAPGKGLRGVAPAAYLPLQRTLTAVGSELIEAMRDSAASTEVRSQPVSRR